MSSQSTEKEIVDLEKRYWQAMKDKDVDTALALSDDECIVTGAQGVGRIDQKKMGEMLRAPNYELRSFAFQGDVQVRLLGSDVAVLAYKVHEELLVEGKPVTLDAADSSTGPARRAVAVRAAHRGPVRRSLRPRSRPRPRLSPGAR